MDSLLPQACREAHLRLARSILTPPCHEIVPWQEEFQRINASSIVLASLIHSWIDLDNHYLRSLRHDWSSRAKELYSYVCTGLLQHNRLRGTSVDFSGKFKVAAYFALEEVLKSPKRSDGSPPPVLYLLWSEGIRYARNDLQSAENLLSPRSVISRHGGSDSAEGSPPPVTIIDLVEPMGSISKRVQNQDGFFVVGFHNERTAEYLREFIRPIEIHVGGEEDIEFVREWLGDTFSHERIYAGDGFTHFLADVASTEDGFRILEKKLREQAREFERYEGLMNLTVPGILRDTGLLLHLGKEEQPEPATTAL